MAEGAHARYRRARGSDSATTSVCRKWRGVGASFGTRARSSLHAARGGCRGAGSFQSWGIGADGELHNLDQWSVEPDPTKGRVFCSAHYFDERDGLVAQGWYEQGTRFLDVSDPTDIRQVGYWIPEGTETWGALYPPTDPTGRVVYSLDTGRGIDVIEIDRPNATVTLPRPPQGLERIPPTGERFIAMLRAAGAPRSPGSAG